MSCSSLSDARHLDWGFVAYPPLTPFLERIGLGLFGISLVGLRLFSVVAQSLAIFVTGLMARELGGGRLAQVIAALAIALSPLPLFQGTEFQYTTFDYLWWVLTAYFVTHLLKTSNPRWWMAIGAAMGLGLPTKYAIVFFIAGILGGAWFWGGMALAILIFLPNLVWQVRHGFVSLHFLQAHTHSRYRRGAREWISAAISSRPARISLLRRCGSPVCYAFCATGAIVCWRGCT
jgi:4-amino-4-deoxy-L-arabinose transferase-like glycosyltransferase